MAYIKEYWGNKEERARLARKHTTEMEQKYHDEIQFSFDNTIVYGEDAKTPQKPNLPERFGTIVNIVPMDTVDALVKFAQGKTAVLNFASFKHPGGMFVNGSKAQEECLCHESFLYNVLRKFESSYYEWNKKHLNKSLYVNRALYTPDVMFHRFGKDVKADVITCAAPNKSAAQKYRNVSNVENHEVLKDRIEFIADIVNENNIDTLILGAFGCGVFGQNPFDVATLFDRQLFTCKNIIYAIPDKNSENFRKFKFVVYDQKQEC